MTDREMNTLAVRVLEELFSSCAVVSVFGSGRKLDLVLDTYILRVQYSCGVVLVFLFLVGKLFLVLCTYLVYNKFVQLCQFFGCGGK
jgi:hypothetical protein